MAGDAKLAGILCEASRLADGRFAAVMGFGVNCASHPEGTPYPATHLGALADPSPTPAHLFHALSARLPDVLASWDRGRGFEAVRAAWLARALRRGTPMSVSARGDRRAGTFETIDAMGRLVLATAAGAVSISVGDVISTATAG